MAHLANRLWRQRNRARDARGADAPCQLQKRQRSQNDSDLLYSPAHQPAEFLLILGRDFNTQRGARHTLSMRQNISK